MEKVRSRDITPGKRFLYGLGGFFGNNLACNVVAFIGGFIAGFISEIIGAGEDGTYGLAVVLAGTGVIMWVRWFYGHVKHESTQVGIIISSIFVALGLVNFLLQGL